MPVRFAVLASGSRGNSTLVQAGGAGVLIDIGLGPRALARRLGGIGASWDRIAAVLLTHTHGDHVNDASLRWLARRGIPLICREEHRPALGRFAGFGHLEDQRLVRHYDDRPFLAPTDLRIEPVELSHDAGPTYGFRVEARAGRRQGTVSLGYLADTGCWRPAMAEALADVDLIGVEFNHDVTLQLNSGRSPWTIRRNLGDRGHLSNDQGAELLAEVLRGSGPGAIRHAVLLHLSQQCNRPGLALGAARDATRRLGRRLSVHAARQDVAYPDIHLAPRRRRIAPTRPAGFPWEAA